MKKILIDPRVFIFPSVMPLRYNVSFFRIFVSGWRFRSLIRFGAAPVSTMKLVSCERPSAVNATVGACEYRCGFSVAIRYSRGRLIPRYSPVESLVGEPLGAADSIFPRGLSRFPARFYARYYMLSCDIHRFRDRVFYNSGTTWVVVRHDAFVRR